MPTKPHREVAFGPLRALVHVPTRPAPERGWPLLLFLHGAGERAGTTQDVARHGVPKVVEREPDFPFVTISPHCPAGHWWSEFVDPLADALDAFVVAHPVDPDRVYLAGMSMGGYGAWQLAARHPERFAAAVMVCGGGDPSWAPRLAKLPILTVHGTADDIVPVAATRRMVTALEALEAPIRAVFLEGAGHDTWTRTFDDADTYTWLLSHTRTGHTARS